MLRLLPLLVAVLASAAPQAATKGAGSPARKPGAAPPGPSIVWPDRKQKPSSAVHADLASLHRIVAHFDFEDAARFPRQLPRDWYRLLSAVSGRPGYPDFGTVRLVDTISHDGAWSLEFDLGGGNMAVALPPGVIRVFPGSRYRLSCWLRTHDLEAAGARLVVRLHSRDGALTGEEFATPPLRSEGAWTQVRLELPEISAETSDMSLELELVQPSANASDHPRPGGDDIKGRMWFDDLEVWQVPAIRFTTDRLGQMFHAGETPTVDVELRDIVSDALVSEIEVRDVDGGIVYRTGVPVASSGGRAHVKLPLKEAGWYRATMTVRGDGVVIAKRTLDLAILNPERGQHGGGHGSGTRFGLALPAAPAAELPFQRLLLMELDPDFAVIPMWDGAYDPTRVEERVHAVRPLVDALLDRRVEPILAIETVPVPYAAARHIDIWQTLQFYGSEDPQGGATLEAWLYAFGQHVDRWQIGSMNSPAALMDSDLDRARVFRAFLANNVAGPILYLPTQADREAPPVPDGIARNVLLPWAARPGTASDYVAPWKDARTLGTIELAPTDLLDDRARIDDLAFRTLDAWRAGMTSLLVLAPLRPGNANEDRATALLPEAIAWRELSHNIAGHAFGGEILLASGVRCYIARSASDIVLVIWREDADEGTTLVMPLASGAITVSDILGRTQVINPEDGNHHIEVTSSPLFVHGVAGHLASVLASARFAPPTIESRRSGQTVELVLHNPYATTMSGTLSISDHQDWDINPRQQLISIPADGEARIPIRVTLPRSATAGETTLSAELEYAAGESGRARLMAKAMIDWPAVDITRSWRFARSVETGRLDLVVTVSVTNRGKTPLDLEAFALAKDFTQNRKPVLKLGPGETATRVFQFADGARRLSGEPVYAGVNDLDGDRRLATAIEIPALLPSRPGAE